MPPEPCVVKLEGTQWVCQLCGARYDSVTAAKNGDCGVSATIQVEPVDMGKVSRSPDGTLLLELSPAEIVDLANRITDAMRAHPGLEPTAQVWIAMLMLAAANLHRLGVPHTEAMQILTIGWSGEETGVFKLGEGG